MNNILFVDGSNLYAGQYDLFGPDKYLNFTIFVEEIQKQLDVSFDKILVYASYSPKSTQPTEKEKQFLKNEGLFYKNIKQTSKTEFFKGYRSPSSGKEKEVDVRLAVDIVDMAHRNKFEMLYLLSGDADFMHALMIAEKRQKKIAIIALQNRIPYRFTHTYNTFAFVVKAPLKKDTELKKAKKLKVFMIEKEGLLKNC